MDDDELEELLIEALRAELRRIQAVFDDATFAEMVRTIDAAQPVPIGDQHCVLLGYEDSIDAVWAVPDPRPEILRRPIPHSHRNLALGADEPTTPTIRTAEYRRIGEFTYKRER